MWRREIVTVRDDGNPNDPNAVKSADWPRGLILAEALARCGGDPEPMVDLFRAIERGAVDGSRRGWSEEEG